eukprot:jgi/Mesvir1/4249/Mv22217-RA.1
MGLRSGGVGPAPTSRRRLHSSHATGDRASHVGTGAALPDALSWQGSSSLVPKHQPWAKLGRVDHPLREGQLSKILGKHARGAAPGGSPQGQAATQGSSKRSEAAPHAKGRDRYQRWEGMEGGPTHKAKWSPWHTHKDAREGAVVDAASTSRDAWQVPVRQSCAPGCSTHGSCNELLGRCDCPSERSGLECQHLSMAACRLFVTSAWHGLGAHSDDVSQGHGPHGLMSHVVHGRRQPGTDNHPLPQAPCAADVPLTCECAQQCAGVFVPPPAFCLAPPLDAAHGDTPPSDPALEVANTMVAAMEAGWGMAPFSPTAKSKVAYHAPTVDPLAPLQARAAQAGPDGAGASGYWKKLEQLQKWETHGMDAVAPRERWFLPPQRCPGRCSDRGYCSAASGTCRCFPPFVGEACERTREEPAEWCLNACNQRGRCRNGFCHCNAGYFGADCSLSYTKDGWHLRRWTSSDLWSPRTTYGLPRLQRLRPTLYIYDLPPLFNTAALRHLDMWATGAEGGLTQGHSALELALHARLLSSHHRVTVPEEADLFVVPLWPSARRVPMQEYAAAAVDYLRATWPAMWDRNNGADHVFVSAGDYGRCEGFAGDVAAVEEAEWAATAATRAKEGEMGGDFGGGKGGALGSARPRGAKYWSALAAGMEGEAPPPPLAQVARQLPSAAYLEDVIGAATFVTLFGDVGLTSEDLPLTKTGKRQAGDRTSRSAATETWSDSRGEGEGQGQDGSSDGEEAPSGSSCFAPYQDIVVPPLLPRALLRESPSPFWEASSQGARVSGAGQWPREVFALLPYGNLREDKGMGYAAAVSESGDLDSDSEEDVKGSAAASMSEEGGPGDSSDSVDGKDYADDGSSASASSSEEGWRRRLQAMEQGVASTGASGQGADVADASSSESSFSDDGRDSSDDGSSSSSSSSSWDGEEKEDGAERYAREWQRAQEEEDKKKAEEAKHAPTVGRRLLSVMEPEPGFRVLPAWVPEGELARIMASSVFCVVPQGRAWDWLLTLSILYGCIPVIVEAQPTVQPFESLLPYERFSLRLHVSQVAQLPLLLKSISQATVEAMQAELSCVWPHFVWSSVVGDAAGEDGEEDAFATLMMVLAAKVQAATGGSGDGTGILQPQMRTACYARGPRQQMPPDPHCRRPCFA